MNLKGCVISLIIAKFIIEFLMITAFKIYDIIKHELGALFAARCYGFPVIRIKAESGPVHVIKGNDVFQEGISSGLCKSEKFNKIQQRYLTYFTNYRTEIQNDSNNYDNLRKTYYTILLNCQ